MKRARKLAAEKGLDDQAIDTIFSTMFEKLAGEGSDSFNDAINDKIKENFANDPKQLEALEALLSAEVQQNSEKYGGKVAGELLKSAIDPETRRLDRQTLQDIQNSLLGIKEARKMQRNLGLKDDCQDAVASVENFIKNDIIRPFLEVLLSGLEGALGDAQSAFSSDALESGIYADALGGLADLGGSSLLMGFGFVGAMDPWTAGGAFQVVMSLVVDIFQVIVGFFLFGCNVTAGDPTCGVLPSQANDVLPIKETRDGLIFMGSGCDSNFEGEMLWYQPAHEILSELLNEAGKSVIEFVNIPINVIKFILDAAAKLFSHMGDVCDYLDGFVELALVEATHETPDMPCMSSHVAYRPISTFSADMAVTVLITIVTRIRLLMNAKKMSFLQKSTQQQQSSSAVILSFRQLEMLSPAFLD